MSGKKDRNREMFSGLFAKSVWFTIERTDYKARPFRLVLWSEHERKPVPIHIMIMTGQDLVDLCDVILDALREVEK